MVRNNQPAGLLLALAAVAIGPGVAALAQSPHRSGSTHILATPRDWAIVIGQSGRVQSAILPRSQTGIVTNEGNSSGTTTGADGQVTTVPNQR